MIRLIAFDLDGTLLNQEKKVDPVTKDALNRLAEQGVFLSLLPDGPTVDDGECWKGCRGFPMSLPVTVPVYMTGRQSSVCTETVWNWKIICLCWLNWISFL